ASTPTLDTVQVAHAPVSFATAGTATTLDVAPPSNQAATTWKTLTLDASVFPSGGASAAGTASVLDAATSQPLASAPINTTGTTTIDLGTVSASQHPKLRVNLALTSAGSATPLVRTLTVTYSPMLAAPSPAPAVDTTAPTGLVLSGPTLLRPFQKTTTFAVGWAASDPESGVASYDVRYRAAGASAGLLGTYVAWLPHT